MDNILNLLKLAHMGNERAENELVEIYRPLAKNLSRRLFLIGGDREDLISEGTIGLLKAIRSYKIDSDVPFKAFAILCIKRQMFVAIKKANKNRDENIVEFSIEDPNFFEVLAEIASTEEDDLDPIIKIMKDERFKELIDAIKSRVNPLEMEILHLFLDGYSYEEIAGKLNITKKKVDNSIYSIKTKVKNVL